MRVIIDRFEGDFAIVETEDKVLINMPVQLIPSEAKEGAVIMIEHDQLETQKRRAEIKALMDSVWNA